MATKIAQELTPTKVLLLSGQAITLHLLKEARTKGYEFETLGKPIHPIDLLARVREITADEHRLLALKPLLVKAWRWEAGRKQLLRADHAFDGFGDEWCRHDFLPCCEMAA